MITSTMEGQWREYRNRVYPGEISAIQNRETHQAFFAGALCLLNRFLEISDLPTPAAEKEFDRLAAEVRQICRDTMKVTKGRN